MKILSRTIYILLILTIPVHSQTKRDTSKTINNEKKKLNTDLHDLGNQQQQFEVPNEIISVPLNLKIYQKILTEENSRHNIHSSEELETGMTDEELTAFEINKNNMERMLNEIYGEDIINLKKILETLGITKDQIVAVAAILKFLFYHPYML
jgi:hypothetical protein